MKDFRFIKDVETSEDVNSIKANGIFVWPLLRRLYFNEIFDRELIINKERENIKKKIFNKLEHAFSGIHSLFHPYNVIIFSNFMERRQVNGQTTNKLVKELINLFPEQTVLLVESTETEPVPFPSGRPHSRTITNDLFFMMYKFLAALRPKWKLKIENEQLLKKINKKYQLNVDYRSYLNGFFIFTSIYSCYFRITKPKMIFLSNYYNLNNQAVIFSAKKKSIPVIEFQHGIIYESHPAYNVFVDMDKLLFPNYLFTVGDMTNSIFNESNYFIDPKNVYSIGSFIIEYYNKSAQNNMLRKEIIQSKKQYSKIIAISSQEFIRKKLLSEIINVASNLTNIMFLFVPRSKVTEIKELVIPPNLKIIENYNVYEVISISDYHVTVSSSCAIEAPALGVPNILLDIDGLANSMYRNILTDPHTTRFVSNSEEFIQLIQNWVVKDKDEIKKLHSKFILQDHKENLIKALVSIQADLSKKPAIFY